jgi:hypothetical protein
LASVPIKKIDHEGNLVDLETGDIFAGEIFVVVYNSALSCFMLVGPTRSHDFPVNSYYIAQVNPWTLIRYGTWRFAEPIELGIFHFENSTYHHAYSGYYDLFSKDEGSTFSTTAKFGQYSLRISSTGSTIFRSPIAMLQFGLQIDMWIRFSSTVVYGNLWYSDISWRLLSGGKIAIYDRTTKLLESPALAYNTWHHVAMAYWWDSNGRYVSMWANGSRIGTVQILTSMSKVIGQTNPVVSREDNTTQDLFVDELRILDTTPTYGDTYNVPTQPYTPSVPPRLWVRTA